MRLFSTPARYGAVAQILHWTTLVLVAAAYLLAVEGPESRVFSAEAESARGLHETFGVLVLIVSVLRLLWWTIDRAPVEPPMPRWMLLAARLGRIALYLLLLAVPLTAIAGSWLGDHPVTLIAIGNVGPFLAPNPNLGRSLFEIHGLIGEAIIWIAGIHAAAALFHHFFLRDRVLKSMLPGKT